MYDDFTPPAAQLCMECAKANRSCCRTELYLTSLCFPLSIAEWQRVRPYAALAVSAVPADGQRYVEAEEAADRAAAAFLAACPESDDFNAAPAPVDPDSTLAPPPEGDETCSAELNVPGFIQSMRDLFPGQKKRLNALFPAGEAHFTLRVRNDGSCVFLGQDGCRLPRAARPLYCRIFPAWVVRGSLTLFLLQDCLISQRAKDPAHCLEIMGENAAHIRALHRVLCVDWALA
jgi:Fe-S-cluster containining protein